MDNLERSWKEAYAYPGALYLPDASASVLDSIRHELNHQAPLLFCDEQSASVDFLEMYNADQGRPRTGLASHVLAADRLLGFKYTCVRNRDELEKTLRIPMFQRRSDPTCRLM